MIRLVADPGVPPGTALVITEPSRHEKQLMLGMTFEDRVLFLAFCGRLVAAKNIAGA